MRAERLLGWLGVAAAVFCATAVTVTAVAIAMPSVRKTLGLTPPPPAPSYVEGERIDLSPELLQAAPSTLVIFFRSDCGVCERNKSALSKLAARDGSAVRVIAVTGRENRHDAEAFVTRIGLKPSRLVTMDLKTVRLRTVPTVVLVDRNGTIRTAVEGALSPQAQDDLVRLMLTSSPER